MHIAIILNPEAGASLLAEQKISGEDIEAALLRLLSDQHIEAEVYHTTLEDPGRGIAARLASQHAELVVAVGGDGTIHSVAHGLIGSESALGIIPAGTMNNLARSLGIPEKLEEACALLSSGEVRGIDVGSANEHLFLEVAGIGLEAALFPAAEEVKGPGLLSTLRGVISGLTTLIRFRPPHVSLTFDGDRTHRYRAIQVTICNSPYYGMHLNVAPEIFMNDGWLNVVIYTNFSKREYIKHAISISQGRRDFAPKIIYRRVKSLRIGTNEPVEIQVDGTVRGSTPAEIRILPGALKVLVPKGLAPGLLPEVRTRPLEKRQWRRKAYA